MNSTCRKVPISVKTKILFSGITSSVGWFVFGFGMIFFWAFAGDADFAFIDYMFNDPVYVQGRIINNMETGASENGETVYKYVYEFIDKTGGEHSGVSYSTGSTYEEGRLVEIKYPKGKPELSRINGLRRKMFGPLVIIVVIFPFVGLVFITFTVKKARSAIRLLQEKLRTSL